MGAWGFLILSFPPKTQPSPQTTAFTSAYSLGGAKWRSPLPGTPTQTNWNRSLPDMDQAPRRGRGQPASQRSQAPSPAPSPQEREPVRAQPATPHKMAAAERPQSGRGGCSLQLAETSPPVSPPGLQQGGQRQYPPGRVPAPPRGSLGPAAAPHGPAADSSSQPRRGLRFPAGTKWQAPGPLREDWPRSEVRPDRYLMRYPRVTNGTGWG